MTISLPATLTNPELFIVPDSACFLDQSFACLHFCFQNHIFFHLIISFSKEKNKNNKKVITKYCQKKALCVSKNNLKFILVQLRMTE